MTRDAASASLLLDLRQWEASALPSRQDAGCERRRSSTIPPPSEALNNAHPAHSLGCLGCKSGKGERWFGWEKWSAGAFYRVLVRRGRRRECPLGP